MSVQSARPGTVPPRPSRAKQGRLLAGVALGAVLCLGAGATPARAQAINATPSTVAGTVSYSRSGPPTPGTETITIQSNSAIINWLPPNLPPGSPYIFLPAGNVVTFQNGTNPDFVVLNRILTNIPSRFDGTVRSRLLGSAGNVPGGTVLFSSPGGIIVGSTAVFDVGNLVLTSLNVLDDSGSFITPGGGFRFDRGSNAADGAVIVEAGGQILAASENSYVALVAPRVIQGGLVDVNGSTAYIAADQVEFRVDQGLFDIVVTGGTDNPTPIVHTGTTTGPASTGGTDNHNIYAVAVARNQAITMLLQGSVGYEPAVSASVDNGAIVISAGYNVTAGQIDPTPVPAPPASIAISDGQFTSNVIGRATGTATATATPEDPLDFTESLTLDAVGGIALVAGAGADVTVGGNLDLSGATVDIDSATAGGFIFTTSTGATTIDNAVSGSTISVLAGGVADLGTLDAAFNISIDGSSILLDSGTAGGDLTLTASGDIAVGFAQAGDDFVAMAGGGFTATTIVTTGLGDDVEDSGGPEEGSNILINAAGAVDIGSMNAVDNIVVDPTSIVIDSATAGGDITLDATGDITVGFAQAGDDFTATAGGIFTGTTVIATGLGSDNENGYGTLGGGGNIFVDADGNIRLDNGDAAADIRLIAGGDLFSSTLLSAGSDVIASAGTGIDIADADAGASIDLFSSGPIDAQSLIAGGPIFISSLGTATIDSADSGASITIDVGDGTFGTLDAAVDIEVDGSTYTVASATAGRDITLTSSGDIGVTFAEAGDDFIVGAGGAFTGGTVNVTGLGPDNDSGSLIGSNVLISAIGDLRLDNSTAPDVIDLDSGGSIASGGTLRADQLLASAQVDILLNDVFVVADLSLLTFNGSIGGNSFNSDGNIILDASENVILAAADAGGAISIAAGALADLGDLDSPLNIFVTAGTIELDSATAGENIGLDASGDITVSFAQAGDDFVADAGGTFTGGTVNVTGLGLDDDEDFNLRGSNVVVTSAGALRLDNSEAPNRIELDSGAGIDSDGTLRADELLATASADILLNDVFVIADLNLVTAGGSIGGNSFNSDGNISLDASGEIDLAAADSGGSITLLGGGDVRLDNGDAVGTITLTSTGGSVFSDPLDGGGGSDGGGPGAPGLLNAGDDILVTAAVDILIDDAVAGDTIQMDAGRDVRVRNLTAAQSVDVEALGSAGFEGQVSAPTIQVSSSDIDISGTGLLGTSATQLVALTVVPTGQQTILGGAADGTGYTLTDAEADRIVAAELSILAPATGNAANRPADVLVRDLFLDGQRIGRLDLQTSGIVQVEGALLLAGVQADGGIDIRADERIEVVNPTGSIRVRDASGLADGSLTLTSANIWSASAGLLDQLRADPNFAGRDEALLDNDGPVEPRGYIEAADVTLFVGSTLFVQNSGTATSFGGITVRESTLRVFPTGQQPVQVFAFGRRINPDGSSVVNDVFFEEAIFETGYGAGFTDEAQFNLCFINTGICQSAAPQQPPSIPGGPEIIEEPVDGSFAITLPGAGDDLVDTSFADEPLIEEPVTSGSDSILWDCDNDDDGDCDEDDNDG